MGRKKKKEVAEPVEPEETVSAEFIEEGVILAEPIPYPYKTLEAPSDIVTVKVKIGTLSFEQGTYQKGEVFQVTRERAALFDENDVELFA